MAATLAHFRVDFLEIWKIKISEKFSKNFYWGCWESKMNSKKFFFHFRMGWGFREIPKTNFKICCWVSPLKMRIFKNFFYWNRKKNLILGMELSNILNMKIWFATTSVKKKSKILIFRIPWTSFALDDWKIALSS